MKRLLILRHAKSSWADSGVADWERPLNARGQRDAPRVGEWLRQHAILPDIIITSDAVRARTTAHAVAKTAGYSRDLLVEPSVYEATVEDLVGAVRAAPDEAQTVLIVGHNPGLEGLVQRLTGRYHGLVTAALVDLELPIDRWRDLSGTNTASIVRSWQPGDE